MWEGVSKVALCLFEHNEKAYHAAIRMMEQYGKAAIVHPTGTGKSYIAFKLIEDNPEKVVIWLSPSEYIFKTQLESLKRNDPDFPLANVHFYTYAKLMCCTQAQLDEIAAQKPAYIILDEFHRAGAECWGESTVALLKLCPDAKLLGLTATNIRYLDNNRDMAEELFDSRVASNMTLGEAVVRGILPAPKYVTTVYQYQKALAKYQARVDNLRAPGIQDVNQKYLDALRRALEQADGLDVSQYTKRNCDEIDDVRRKLDLPLGKVIYVYSGGFIDRKNQREAITAFMAMKKDADAVLLLLGDGTNFEALKDEFSKNTNILFRGKVSNVNEYLHASDVYLATSKSEGLPNGVLEAMACGLPVLLSDIPQHMEVLEADPQCGHSYKLGNVEQLSALMDQMVDENLLEMGERSYTAVMENFTAEGMSKRYQNLYLKLMDKGGK